ncbi:MAG: hypothetical protein ABI460_09170 [Caldimonas sp.]
MTVGSSPSSAGDEAAQREAPTIVRSRSRPILLIGLGALATAALMLAVRRGDDLDFEDWIWSAGAFVVASWLVAQSVGLLLRRAAAGHALRLDAEGLHHPGWAVVPWRAIHALRLRRLGGDRSLWHLVLEIDAACVAPTHGGYTRWLYGPIEGLWRRRGAIEIPLIALDVEPQALAATAERWRARLGGRT